MTTAGDITVTLYKYPPIKELLSNISNSVINTSFNHIGSTSERPPFSEQYGSVKNSISGFQYFDTTLGKPVWWNGTAWVDATSVISGTSTSGTFANRPTVSANSIPIGFKYFCTDKQTTEGVTDGIEIIHKGDDVWVDALGRVIS